MGYSNDINPFGDSNLMQPFIWGKKKEKEKYENKSIGVDKSDKKRLELINEIEKVRKRRTQREEEVAELERLRDEEHRLRESQQYSDWQSKEESFLLEQIEMKSKLRLIDYRMKPIDRLVKNIVLVETSKMVVKLNSDINNKNKIELKPYDYSLLQLRLENRTPIDIINQLSINELRDLIEDIESFIVFELSKSFSLYKHYWESLKIIVKTIIHKEQLFYRNKDDDNDDGDGDNHLRGNRNSSNSIGVHDSIAKDVSELLNGKDVNELDDLEKDINKNIRDGHGTDIEYWELLKTEISIQRSKTVVDNIHQDLIKQYINMNREVKAYLIANNIISDDNKNSSSISSDTKDQDNDNGDNSQKIVLNEELDEREEKMKISDEIQVTTTNYWWKDKYRPRKPRYFNRVKTGWDRTKYNLTHYDKDNPPPKMIQGYKFTLFFPDLIDKQKTPRYFLEPCHEGNNGSRHYHFHRCRHHHHHFTTIMIIVTIIMIIIYHHHHTLSPSYIIIVIIVIIIIIVVIIIIIIIINASSCSPSLYYDYMNIHIS